MGFNRYFFFNPVLEYFKRSQFLKITFGYFSSEIKSKILSPKLSFKFRINISGNSKNLIETKIVHKYNAKLFESGSNLVDFGFSEFLIKESIVGVYFSQNLFEDETCIMSSNETLIKEIYELLQNDEDIKDKIKLCTVEKPKFKIHETIEKLMTEAIDFMKYNLSKEEIREVVKELNEIHEYKSNPSESIYKLHKNGKMPICNASKFEKYFCDIAYLIAVPSRTGSTIVLDESYQSYIKENGEYPFPSYQTYVIEYVYEKVNQLIEKEKILK